MRHACPLAPAILMLAGPVAAADWESVAAGIAYRHVLRDGTDAHLVRVDLDDAWHVVATAAAERGLTVSEFARRRAALVAVNGDYFDVELRPIGMAMGDGQVWAVASEQLRRQEVVGVGDGRVAIFPRAEPLREPEPWMTGAVSGWPMLVTDCEPVVPLPGSDPFALAPHPRTAIGLSADERQLLLVVADGRREGVPGLTLPELAALMIAAGACTALNLDGGGSSALWLRDRIVNLPSDGVERSVANHIAVVAAPPGSAGAAPDGAGSPDPP